MQDLNLMIAIKGNKEENEENNDLNLFLNNNKSTFKNMEKNVGHNDIGKLNSLLQTISFIDDENEDKEVGDNDNLFGESIQNISEIKNNNSTLLFGADDYNLKN